MRKEKKNRVAEREMEASDQWGMQLHPDSEAVKGMPPVGRIGVVSGNIGGGSSGIGGRSQGEEPKHHSVLAVGDEVEVPKPSKLEDGK